MAEHPPPVAAADPAHRAAGWRGLLRALRARPTPQDVASVSRLSRMGAIATGLNAVIFVASQIEAANSAFLLPWLGMTGALCVWVGARRRATPRALPARVSPKTLRRLLISCFVIALPWVVLILFSFLHGTASNQMFTMIICAGISAGGTFMLYRVLTAVLVYIGTITGTLSLIGFLTGHPDATLIASFSLLFAGLLLWNAHVSADVAQDLDAALLAKSETLQELTKAHQQITELALVDGVTGLANRKSFYTALTEATAQGQDRFTVLALDLDLFKNVNDTFGHSAGDDLLKGVATRLRDFTGAGDLVARLGGDEFAIFARDLDAPPAFQAYAQQIIRGLQTPFSIAGRNVYTGTSIGAAHFPADADTTPDLMQRADVALNHAKAMGRNRAVEFSPDLAQKLAHADWIEVELRTALARGDVGLRYQPKVSLSRGRVLGAEALIRWTHPERGRIGPDDFLPVAAERGLMPRVTETVFDIMAADVLAWRAQDLSAGRIAVNIHPVDLKTPHVLIERLDALIDRGIDSRQIILEITEGCFVGRGSEAALFALDAAAERGFTLSLDDFGTGHAALSHLRKLPVGELKIDRSFVAGLPGSDADRAIVSATIAIAHGMGLAVVAEGVETEAQRAYLADLEVPAGQGHFWAKPLSASDYRAFLIADRTSEGARPASRRLDRSG